MNNDLGRMCKEAIMAYFKVVHCREPIGVAVRSKAQIYSRSIAGITGSNPVEGTNVRILCLSCVVYVAGYATG